MGRIALFLEDLAHQTLIEALVKRVAEEYQVSAEMTSISARGGHGKALAELRRFLSDLKRGKAVGVPDILVIATDANCKGYNTRYQEVMACIPDVYRTIAVCAAPDPHIERWMLVDSRAFKKVLGRGCTAPDQKCDRDRYKSLLNNAIRDAGVKPILGGMEHAESLVEEMDLDVAARHDRSLGQFIAALRSQFNRLKSFG